jgi:hypothetical protein
LEHRTTEIIPQIYLDISPQIPYVCLVLQKIQVVTNWVPVDGFCGGLDGVTDLDIFQRKLIVAETYFQGDCAGNPGNYKLPMMAKIGHL